MILLGAFKGPIISRRQALVARCSAILDVRRKRRMACDRWSVIDEQDSQDEAAILHDCCCFPQAEVSLGLPRHLLIENDDGRHARFRIW